MDVICQPAQLATTLPAALHTPLTAFIKLGFKILYSNGWG
jgi:hypothetical protein